MYIKVLEEVAIYAVKLVVANSYEMFTTTHQDYGVSRRTFQPQLSRLKHLKSHNKWKLETLNCKEGLHIHTQVIATLRAPNVISLSRHVEKDKEESSNQDGHLFTGCSCCLLSVHHPATSLHHHQEQL
jgi:hypothetical protein